MQVIGPAGTVQGSATGFVLRDADRSPYLITNRHVVTGQNSLHKLQVHGNAPVPSALRIPMHHSQHPGTWRPVVLDLGDPDGRPPWREHPSHGPWMDVIALPLGNVLEEEGLALYDYPQTRPVARMELGTELQVIGFPVRFDPIHDGAPLGVWTRGTIAWPPRQPWRNLPALLIDCRSRPGQSGSPVVFSASEFSSYRRADGRIGTGPVQELIGVYSGRINDDSDVGVVWKRDAVREIVEDGIVRELGAGPEHPWVPPLEKEKSELTGLSALSEPVGSAPQSPRSQSGDTGRPA